MTVARSLTALFSPVPTVAPPEAHWETAALERRLAALTLDTIVVGLIWVLVLIPVYSIDLFLGHRHSDATLGLPADEIAFLTAYPVAVLYLGLCNRRDGARNGQTFGKNVVGVRIVRRRGGLPIDERTTWLRAAVVGLFLPICVPLFGLLGTLHDTGGAILEHEQIIVNVLTLGGLLVAGITPTRRTYYDWIAGTAVVRAKIIDPTIAPSSSTDAPDAPLTSLPIQPRPRDSALLVILGLGILVLIADTLGLSPR